jgi:hypothetical protein
LEKIKVITYSGYRKNERPQAFFIYGERIEVDEILSKWIEEDFEKKVRKKFFQLKGSDNYIYKVCHDELTDEWFLAK